MLVTCFGTKFATSRPHQLTWLALVNIRQEKYESLSVFMERFGNVSWNIRNLNPYITLHYLVTTLNSGPFVDSLCKIPIVDLNQLRMIVSNFM